MAEKRKVIKISQGVANTEKAQELLKERETYKQVEETAKDSKDRVSKEVMTMLEGFHSEYPEASFDIDVAGEEGKAWRLTVRQNAGKRELSVEKLLEMGVSGETIGKAWVEGPPSREYLDVRKVKAGE